MGKKAEFAELNVGITLDHIRKAVPHALFENRPLPRKGEWLPDPSHSQLLGLPTDALQSEIVGDMIAECVQRRYPAKPITETN